MAYGVSNGHVTNDVTWPQRCCEAVRSAILATDWLLVSKRAIRLTRTLQLWLVNDLLKHCERLMYEHWVKSKLMLWRSGSEKRRTSWRLKFASTRSAWINWRRSSKNRNSMNKTSTLDRRTSWVCDPPWYDSRACKVVHWLKVKLNVKCQISSNYTTVFRLHISVRLSSLVFWLLLILYIFTVVVV